MSAAIPATARGPENGWLPSPLAAKSTMAKTAPHADPMRESAELFILFI